MIGLYRTHQEQIQKVEQSLKAPFQIRTVDPNPYERTGTENRQVKRPEPDGISQIQKSFGHEVENAGGALSDKQIRLDSKNSLRHPVSAIKCLRCNACMPEMDFLYTKKTGLCISCWEEQEA